jgi:hypothetical protein
MKKSVFSQSRPQSPRLGIEIAQVYCQVRACALGLAAVVSMAQNGPEGSTRTIPAWVRSTYPLKSSKRISVKVHG